MKQVGVSLIPDRPPVLPTRGYLTPAVSGSQGFHYHPQKMLKGDICITVKTARLWLSNALPCYISPILNSYLINFRIIFEQYSPTSASPSTGRNNRALFEYKHVTEEMTMGSGQGIILISINKDPRNRCFQPQYHRFRGQNWPDKKPGALEADIPLRFQRPFVPLL